MSLVTTYLIDTPLLRPILAPTIENGLQHLSQVMVEKISPLRKDVIRQQIGRLDRAEMTRLEAALVQVTGLAHAISPTNGTEQLREQP